MKWLASIGLSGTVLSLFAAITSVAIGWTYLSTKAQIDFEVRRAEARQLLEIFPPDTHDNEIVDDVFEVAAETPLLGIREGRQGYRVRQGNTVIGVILPATARDGYSGDIRALVGVRRDGSVAGVRVVAHRETPGLGDKVDLRKSDWVLDFNERSLANPALSGWNVEKAGGVFDQFTGATVTPRAVILATRRALEYATLNASTLFETEADSA
ncbi:MAG: electron transport complex subunit RsxG [Congregibacter sp.]|jgi:electron transport complex protein RnfG|nr:electron transport complex subunit RsxG [Congregibacter sp.]